MTRTPTEVIASVEQWASHVITQPNDPMRKDVAAVLAMARRDTCKCILDRTPMSAFIDDDYDKALGEWGRADDAAKSALSAAGVGGGE